MLLIFPGAEAELGWFFGAGDGILGGCSSMGPMLEHASTYYVAPEERRRVPREAVTAWPTGRERAPEGFVPDDVQLRRFGLVSRRLRDAGQRMPQAPEILSAYFGEEGDRFARLKQGRMAALLRFTPAGAQLIARQRKKERGGGARLKLTDAQRVENSVAAATIGAGQASSDLLAVGIMQAQDLLHRALTAYVSREARWADAAE